MTTADLVWMLLVSALCDGYRRHAPGSGCGCRWDKVCPEMRSLWSAETDLLEWRPE